jgi:hypothetical protein
MGKLSQGVTFFPFPYNSLGHNFEKMDLGSWQWLWPLVHILREEECKEGVPRSLL